MEKVVAVDSSIAAPLRGGKLPVAFPGSAFKEGIVQGSLGPGRYSVVLDGGLKIEVRGATALKPGDKVQVLTRQQAPAVPEPAVEEGLEALDNGSILSAFMPLAFGGTKANAKLEVHVPERPKGGFRKGSSVIYFVLVVQTEGQGEVQWGIHLNGRQVALQVYAPHMGNKGEKLKTLVGEVEKALTGRGFVTSGQVIFSRHPLKKPSDTGLNVRG